MTIKDKIKKNIKKKNLNPMNNRKKVGIILFATSIGLFFLFAFRLTYIVATGEVAGTKLKEKTAELYEGNRLVKAKRGAILDRNGNPIAEDATSFSVFAVLSDTYVDGKGKKLYAQQKDFSTIATVLEKYIGLPKAEGLTFLNNGINEDGSTKYQVEFGSKGKNITLEAKQNIEKELKENKIEGIKFDDHPARIYPNGVFSSHFIGYTEATNKDNKNTEDQKLVGKMGLEEVYNKTLAGQDGRIYYEKDSYGNPLPGTVAEEQKAVDGQDIYTTLDNRLQSKMESGMDAIVEQYKPENLGAMLMNAKTGEILAMGQRPSFNPETKAGLADVKPPEEPLWRNILVEDKFEPGSTMKIFTAAAAMQEGMFDPNATFVSGRIKIADRWVKDHDEGAKGILTYRQALSWSSNVGMVHLEQRMGDAKWNDYLKKFKFGESTNSGLLNESAGSLPTENIVDRAMSAFGQAVSVTHFQMMQAYTAVANNGTMVKPQFINKIVDKNTGAEKITQPEVVGNPISPEVASTLRSYLVDTIEDENYGIAHGVYEVPGYHIAAKTGTAEITGTSGYMEGATDYTYSVVEMIPAEDPEYILYVTLKKPEQYDRNAIAVLANPLLKLAMDIKDTDTGQAQVEPVAENITVADYRNLEVEAAKAAIQEANLEPIVIGQGQVVKKQSTKAGEVLLAKQKLLLLTDGEKIMPDVTGWSKSDLLKLGKFLNVNTEFTGEGYVTAQSIAPGEKITGKTITFTLAGAE
ncbi:penicillin-binding protein [Enterococcus rivorum]|uniref:Cell division protein FtsI n=1 Tax=Enterococcus rivorum TaxID=762845 RepID=A0A1E5KVF8_9ENTE|nr:penicillin-binding protein [Enterococcus rivorum]MBP2098350.1 penicillin-binding protein 2X [Enterococcus rivorum]OEH81861.1 cell division protein FtsI [Enterococcus rivorum]